MEEPEEKAVQRKGIQRMDWRGEKALEDLRWVPLDRRDTERSFQCGWERRGRIRIVLREDKSFVERQARKNERHRDDQFHFATF